MYELHTLPTYIVHMVRYRTCSNVANMRSTKVIHTSYLPLSLSLTILILYPPIMIIHIIHISTHSHHTTRVKRKARREEKSEKQTMLQKFRCHSPCNEVHLV